MIQKSINPYNNELLAEIPEFTKPQIDESIKAAETAFKSWRKTSFVERADLLNRCSDILLNKKEELARLITNEMGKVYKESSGEIEKCAWVCRYYAENGEKFLRDEQLSTEDQRAFISFEPLGVVLAVMPWNFPFWQVFRFAAPAVMAGNTGLLKHASNVPQCALAIEDIFHEADAPEGIFKSLIIPSGKVNSIIDDWRVKAVTLTGSELAGSKVAERSGRNIKKTVLELGGSDPFIVLADADLETTVEIAVKARMINCGQSCIAAKRFIVEKDLIGDFLEKFDDKMQKLKMGDPMDPDTDYGSMARKDLASDLNEQVNESVKKGARLLKYDSQAYEGAFYKALILSEVKPGMPAYEQEIFGPVAAVMEAENENDLVRIANSSKYGLGASLWTANEEKGLKLAREIESGAVFVNKMVASHPAIPFGGIKMSGYGRELSYLGIREFVNAKSIVY